MIFLNFMQNSIASVILRNHEMKSFKEYIKESEEEPKYFFHGGKDFEDINLSKAGSGEPGGIRPLGKTALYGGVAFKNEHLENAINLAKVYGKKYGGHVHGFSMGLDADTSNVDKPGWARGGLGKETSSELRTEYDFNTSTRRSVKAKQLEYERLPSGRIEGAVHDPSILRRVGKWKVETPTEDIIRDITAERDK